MATVNVDSSTSLPVASTYSPTETVNAPSSWAALPDVKIHLDEGCTSVDLKVQPSGVDGVADVRILRDGNVIATGTINTPLGDPLVKLGQPIAPGSSHDLTVEWRDNNGATLDDDATIALRLTDADWTGG